LTLSPRRQTALFALLLFAAGLAYRATFLNQGFNASDEGFLPALALRVVKGQVVYRDFYFALPPLTLYKEAAVAAALGNAYGFLASRWVFAVEVSLGSVLAFMIIRRYVSPRLAFVVTLPTVFFTTVLYAYSNFNFDAQLLFLVAVLILAWEGERERIPIVLLAGGFCGLAFLAKPTYLAMAVGVCILGLLRPWMAGPRRWPFFAAGFIASVGIVFGIIAVAGLFTLFRHQAFGLLLQARSRPIGFYLYQDWPHWLLAPGRAIFAPLALLILLAAARIRPWLAIPATVILAGVLAVFIVPALPSSVQGIPTNGQMRLLVGALAVILAINLIASTVTVAARLPGLAHKPWAERVREEMFPPSLPIVAAVLEYLQGVDLSSMRFAYVGTFIGIPVALTCLYAGWRIWGGAPAVRVVIPVVAGAFIAVAGAVVTHGSPYLDGPRDQMAADFSAPRLAGIKTVPSNATHVNDLVAEIEKDTKPGDRLLVFPEGQSYYVLTGRTNPTRVDWYDPLGITPAIANQAVADLQRDPPNWIMVQDYQESDLLHLRPNDFENEKTWKPIYDFITSSYNLVSTIDGDVRVYRLKQPAISPTAGRFDAIWYPHLRL
jgi:hypothetical protein